MIAKHINLIVICILSGWLGCKGEPEEKVAPPAKAPRVAAPADLLRGKDGRMYFRNELEPFTGYMKASFPDGKPRIEFPHAHGVLHGRVRSWHPNGQLKMESHFQMGHRHGNWDEWDSEGLQTIHRVFSKGQFLHEEVPSELNAQVNAVAAARKQLDQTVWHEETAAQSAEEVFVHLWDALRAATDKFKPLIDVEFSEITLPVAKGESQEVDWGIRDQALSQGGEALSSEQWRAWLEARKEQGWKIIETEWHQENFALGKDSAPSRSLFRFVIHAQREQQRAIIRGELEVLWTIKDGEFLADKLNVKTARILERTGAAPFAARREIIAQVDRKGVSVPVLVKDLNADGLPEILLPGANELYWNRGGWKFERTALFSRYSTVISAGVVADFNGDARVDLLGMPKQGQPVLYLADANGRFTAAPQRVSVDLPELHGHSAVTAGDVDGDGDLDAWVMQYKFPYMRGQFPTPYYDANDGFPSYLLLNDGKGNFTEATSPAGLAAKGHRRTYSGSFVDLDEDGDLDLLNVSDFAGLDLYRNNGRGQFTDITAQLGDTRFSFGMSHALGDFDDDGRMDLYMTGMGSTTARRLEAMGAGRAEHAAHQVHRMKMGYGNRLFLGGKDGFKQTPTNDEVARAGWCWGVTGADFDLDGDRDIYIANGHLSRKSSKDHCTVFWRHDIFTNNSEDSAVMNKFFSTLNQQSVGESWNGFEHNVFYLNDGTGRFLNVAFLLGVSYEFDSRMVVGADFDADGRPDLLVAELRRDLETRSAREVLHLISNQWPTKGNWLGVQLQGAPGISPLGAVITVKTADRIWRQPVVSGDSLWSQHPAIVNFGLGKISEVDSIEVLWPGGTKTSIEKPKLNQYHLAKAK